MTLGLDWNEDAPYTSPANSEIAMELAPDRYRYLLERPRAAPPGTRWRYCGGASALLGRLIADGTGQILPDFARDALFVPLGITGAEWMAGADGVASAASGLRLAPRDLARIGQCVLRRGDWHGRQVIPAGWLDQALRQRVEISPGFHYGYQWYLGASGPVRWWSGMGNGGQRLLVVPWTRPGHRHDGGQLRHRCAGDSAGHHRGRRDPRQRQPAGRVTIEGTRTDVRSVPAGA